MPLNSSAFFFCYCIRLRAVRSRLKKGNPITLQVKTERLTPDNNSTSSRSVTPSSSSHPGTPPNATTLGGPEGPPPPHHLKHMEQMMGRNYSDFMRSLAAKYNNANPNEYVHLILSITFDRSRFIILINKVNRRDILQLTSLLILFLNDTSTCQLKIK